MKNRRNVWNKYITNDKVEELADMIEVIISLAKLENKSLDDIIKIASKKREKRGGFEKKIFLEKVLNKKNK